MIEVKNLTKRYGPTKAVDNISFVVNPGEILGFLGPNGAGKSTTMNILAGYLSSNEGTVTINGVDVLENPIAVKRMIGYLPEQPPLYLDMTAEEYLSFLFDLKKVKLPRKQHLEDICGRVKISDVRPRLIKNLSKGYRQRVGLAQALLGNPDVLILDEPTVGLDPKQIIEIRTLIKDLGKNHTVILSSHILPEVRATCDRILVISQGQIRADDTPDGLAGAYSADRSLTLRIEGPEPEIPGLLSALPGVTRVDRLGEREPGVYGFRLESAENADPRRELFRALAQKSWPILELSRNELSLEDIFLKLTSDREPPNSPPPGQPAPDKAPPAKKKGGNK